MSSFCYDSFIDQMARGAINLASDTFYGALVDATYTPDQGAHAYRSSVTGEVSGTGYAAGGVPVTITLNKNTASHQEEITVSAISIPSSTITARRLVIYKHHGGAASADELVCQIDFGANISDTNGTFSVAASTITLHTPS